jgi:hypothetical protein
MAATDTPAGLQPEAGPREVPPGPGPAAGEKPVLARLLDVDGYGPGVTEQAWTDYVRHWISLFGAGPGTSVWQAGCGAGSFLYPFFRHGCTVGGSDLFTGLLDEARAAMPAGTFGAAEAAAPAIPPADLIVSSGLFTYFDTPVYAETILQRMAASARRAVLITDIPDLGARAPAPDGPAAPAGGPPGTRQPALPLQYYDRDWFAAALRAAGLPRAAAAGQFLAGDQNAAFRFNAWGWRG